MTALGIKAGLGLGIALVLTVIVFIICGALESRYDRRRAALEQDLYQLPFFNSAAETERIRQDFELGDVDFNAVLTPLDQIRQRIAAEVETLSDQKYPKGGYTAALKQRQEKLKVAKIGDTVKFRAFVPDGSTVYEVKGVLEMRERTPSGSLFFINGKQFKLRQVVPEDRYLFDETVAIRMSADLSKVFRAEYNEQKDQFARQQRARLEQQYIPAAGYHRYGDGRWLSPAEIARLELERRERALNLARDQQLKTILKPYTFLGMPLFRIEFVRASAANRS